MLSVRRAIALIVGVQLAACAPRPATDVAGPLATAREFYRWYGSAPESGGAGFRMTEALRVHPEAFEPDLLTALTTDLAASAAEPDMVVGLDFDPFVGSQDPCDRYDVDSLGLNDDRVVIIAKCPGAVAIHAGVGAELVRRDGRWRFYNFVYGDSTHLRGELERLQRARDSMPAPPTRPDAKHP